MLYTRKWASYSSIELSAAVQDGLLITDKAFVSKLVAEKIITN
jgi:hypothetical protein